MDWITFQRQLAPVRHTRARTALANRFAKQTVARPELGRAVGGGMRTAPIYAVVPYKEAFSPAVVDAALDIAEVESGLLLDPFVGAGTSLLVGTERGLASVGVDILPFSSFTSDTLLRIALADWEVIDDCLPEVLEHPKSSYGRFPDFPVRAWAFGPAALCELQDLDTAIAALPQCHERDLLRLALLCSVEVCSQATKDGTSLRRRPSGSRRTGRFGVRYTRADVQSAFLSRVEALRAGSVGRPAPIAGSMAITGDARELPTLLRGHAPFDVAVFSPPYPNRYDYVSKYQLELGFGFVDNSDELRRLRKAQLRSHLEAPWAIQRTVELAALDEFLSSYLASSHRTSQANRVFRMVCGYFEDMSKVFDGLRTIMRPKSRVAIVIGTQVFGGELLPTDLLLAEVAEVHGFHVDQIWWARDKGVAVQQRRHLRKPLASRETVLILTS
jgi:hypothetical protein